jgi:hypothetical protein
MKERYARLNQSKLPDDYQEQFMIIRDSTENFSDEDLISIFQENFDDLYNLVEKKYPDAIETGGTIKKAKPTKVKKVKPKKVETDLSKVPISLKKKLSEDEIDQIENIFDKTTSLNDEGLEMILVAQVGLSEVQAKKWVAYRDKYLKLHGGDGKKYSERTKLKKITRRQGNKQIVKTRDGHEFDRQDPANKGKSFYDENGKKWKCKRYSTKLDECIFADEEGKEISGCLRDMYVHNPVDKRKKGDIIDECRETLKEAGYKVLSHKKGSKKITRKEPRPEKEIIKERVENTFTPITKDLIKSDEAAKENKEVVEVLNRIQNLFVKVFNRISNLADDGKAEKLEKIEKLLIELIE